MFTLSSSYAHNRKLSNNHAEGWGGSHAGGRAVLDARTKMLISLMKKDTGNELRDDSTYIMFGYMVTESKVGVSGKADLQVESMVERLLISFLELLFNPLFMHSFPQWFVN